MSKLGTHMTNLNLGAHTPQGAIRTALRSNTLLTPLRLVPPETETDTQRTVR